MTVEEFKGALLATEITQADFARLVGVTSRAVTLWIAGERPIPGPIEAYVRVLNLLPPNLRRVELNRLKTKGSGMRDGMFGITFQGHESFGAGLLIFENGRVYGTDEAGVRYDGGYVFDEKSGLAHVNIKVTFPPNVRSVFGVSNPYEWAFDVTTAFNPNSDSGALAIKSSVGRLIRARYVFLRSLPDAA